MSYERYTLASSLRPYRLDLVRPDPSEKKGPTSPTFDLFKDAPWQRYDVRARETILPRRRDQATDLLELLRPKPSTPEPEKKKEEPSIPRLLYTPTPLIRPRMTRQEEYQAREQAQRTQQQAERIIRTYVNPQWEPHYPGTRTPIGRGVPMPGGRYFGGGVPMPGGGMFGGGVPMPGGGMFHP